MHPTIGTSFACFLAHSGAGNIILHSTTLPESKVLALLGGGLVILASLVRRLYPIGGVAAPKSLQVLLWISPDEIAQQLSHVDGD
jgi:hypothetical protein